MFGKYFKSDSVKAGSIFLVIIIVLLLIASLALYRLITRAITWWRSIMKPRIIDDEMDPEVSIGGDYFANQVDKRTGTNIWPC